MRVCTSCGEAKPLSAFYLKRKDSDERRTECGKCGSARYKRWTNGNRAQSRQRAVEWYAANRERVLQQDRARSWRKGLRRAASPKAHPAWSIDFFLREAYDLARLRTAATNIKWEVDHIVPLRHAKVCGLHAHTNIRVIPSRLNRVKSNAGWPGMPEPEITGFF